MICNERDIRNRTVRALAEAVMTAARTAPKAKGRDLVEAALITGEDLGRLAEAMRELSAESGMRFLLRDADNVLQAEAVLVIGIREAGYGCGLNCSYCGYPSCEAKPADVPCLMNGADVGIAIGSACASAADLRLDSRVMFSAGWAAKRMNVLDGADLVFGILLGAASKNPFFDRKPHEKKTDELAAEISK